MARHELSVTDATKRGVARLVSDAEQGDDVIITRHRRPVAAVVSVRRFQELAELESDLRDLALVVSRAAADTGRRTSLDDVLAELGHTRETLPD